MKCLFSLLLYTNKCIFLVLALTPLIPWIKNILESCCLMDGRYLEYVSSITTLLMSLKCADHAI